MPEGGAPVLGSSTYQKLDTRIVLPSGDSVAAGATRMIGRSVLTSGVTTGRGAVVTTAPLAISTISRPAFQSAPSRTDQPRKAKRPSSEMDVPASTSGEPDPSAAPGPARRSGCGSREPARPCRRHRPAGGPLEDRPDHQSASRSSRRRCTATRHRPGDDRGRSRMAPDDRRPERPGRQVDDVESPVGPDEHAGDARKVPVAEKRRKRGRGRRRARGRVRVCPEADGAVTEGAVAEGPDATPRSWRGAVNHTAATERTTVATRAAARGPRIRSARPRRRPPPRPVRSRQVDSPSRWGGIRQSSATLRISPASRSSSGPGAAAGGVPSRGLIESP